MEPQWLTWAKRLQATAANGLHFCQNSFDLERYHEVADIAQAMIASLSERPVADIANVLSEGASSYMTPKIDVRAAIIDCGKILLVREKSDGLWALPGGFADVGLSAGENAVKEVWEEAGIRVEIAGLYSVRHKAKHDYQPSILDFYKLFFLCTRRDGEPLKPGIEVLDAAFFHPAELPPLSTARIIARDIAEAFAFQASPTRITTIE